MGINQEYTEELAKEKIIEVNRKRTEEKARMLQEFILKLDHGETRDLRQSITIIQNYLIEKVKKFN